MPPMSVDMTVYHSVEEAVNLKVIEGI
jgi:hypothetical protein